MSTVNLPIDCFLPPELILLALLQVVDGKVSVVGQALSHLNNIGLESIIRRVSSVRSNIRSNIVKHMFVRGSSLPLLYENEYLGIQL